MAQPMKRFLEDFATELATVRVGPKDAFKEYKMPKGILRDASPWFEAALKGHGFKEGRTSTIDMPEDRPEDFEVFFYFVFHGNIAYEASECGVDIETRSHDFVQCCSVWSFAEKYLLPGLKNSAMFRACLLLVDFQWAIDDSAPEKLPPKTLALAWQALPEDSIIRSMIADYVVDTMEKKDPFDVEDCIANCPGLIRAMHASEAQLHKSAKGDFPRYRKPVKSSLLDKVDADRSLCTYDPGWECLLTSCEECGYGVPSSSIEYRCMKCKKKDCKDHVITKRLVLCHDCSEDYN